MSPIVTGVLCIIIGFFPVAAVLFNWQFFMQNRKARVMASILGETGMRVFYVLLGLAFIIGGFLLTIGVVKIH